MKKVNYFEGWYFKDQCKDITIAFIPEISYGKNGEKTGSLQIVFDGKSYFFEYDNPVIMNMKNSLYVVLGNNVFTEACVHLDIDCKELYMKGDIFFDQDKKIPSFNVMGPLNYIPTGCYHKIFSMEQQTTGKISIDGRQYDFTSGKGYMEMDRGKSFPRTYLWSQCNWFDQQDCQIVVAAATVPIGRFNIMGSFACIGYEGKKYKFATYLGADVINFSINGFRIQQGKYSLEGRRIDGVPIELKSPSMGQMSNVTNEYLTCNMEYSLKKRNEEIFLISSDKASFEFR